MSFPQRPDYLSAPNPALADRFTGGLTAPQPPNISIKNGRFTVRGASGETRRDIPPALSLDVIIVDANEHASRMFFEGNYDPNEAAAPDCFSDNGEAPSAFAAKPQAANCVSCPQAVWGSKINQNGKPVPACSSKKKLAVLVGGDSSGVLHLLAVPPNSLKGYRAYVDAIIGNGELPYRLITRVSFADGEIGTLKFDWLDYIPQQLVGHVEGLIGSAEVDSVVGNNDKPRLAALPGPAPVQQLQHQPVLDQAAQRFQQGFAPPQQQFAPPQQGFAPPQQGFAPPQQGFAPPQQQFAPPQQHGYPNADTSFTGAAQTLGFAPQPLAEPPKRTRRSSAEVAAEKAAKEAAAAGQTFVGPGPITQAFGAPPAQQGGFMGGGSPPPAQAFGVANNPPPPSSAVEDMLAKAFSLPTK
jgi:hypothetical protein